MAPVLVASSAGTSSGGSGSGGDQVLYTALELLAAGLPREGGDYGDDSDVMSFHYGLGLGMLVQRLSEERFAEVAGNKVIECNAMVEWDGMWCSTLQCSVV